MEGRQGLPCRRSLCLRQMSSEWDGVRGRGPLLSLLGLLSGLRRWRWRGHGSLLWAGRGSLPFAAPHPSTPTPMMPWKQCTAILALPLSSCLSFNLWCRHL